MYAVDINSFSYIFRWLFNFYLKKVKMFSKTRMNTSVDIRSPRHACRFIVNLLPFITQNSWFWNKILIKFIFKVKLFRNKCIESKAFTKSVAFKKHPTWKLSIIGELSNISLSNLSYYNNRPWGRFLTCFLITLRLVRLAVSNTIILDKYISFSIKFTHPPHNFRLYVCYF